MAVSSDLPLRSAAEPEVERLGKYELLRHLATGGMADIYLARVTGIEGFEKIVVVKRILKDLLRNQEMVRMFLDEARLAATLYHPNVVPVYDVGSVGGDYFFAMEFVHGENVGEILRTVTANGQEISMAEAISIVLGVCSGIHYAHEKVGMDGRPLNIVHRDVSPSNVLVSYDGAVKIVDFGIAKAENRLSQKTQTGGIRGKFSYMSPEQCQAKPLDRRSDLFSLSILLYELTTCTKLYRGNSEYDVMRRIVEVPAPPPSTRKPDYPAELERIVMKGLARSVDDRYATAQQMQLELEAFMLENRLSTSPIQLARLMERLFADRISSWRRAQERGLSLIDHLSTENARRPPKRHRTNESLANGHGDSEDDSFSALGADLMSPSIGASPFASAESGIGKGPWLTARKRWVLGAAGLIGIAGAVAYQFGKRSGSAPELAAPITAPPMAPKDVTSPKTDPVAPPPVAAPARDTAGALPSSASAETAKTVEQPPSPPTALGSVGTPKNESDSLAPSRQKTKTVQLRETNSTKRIRATTEPANTAAPAAEARSDRPTATVSKEASKTDSPARSNRSSGAKRGKTWDPDELLPPAEP